MKSDGIQRLIGGQRNNRTTGDAPILGKVDRIPTDGDVNRRRRRSGSHRKSRATDKSRPAEPMSLRMKLIMAATVLIGAAAIIYELRPEPIEGLTRTPVGEALKANPDRTSALEFPAPTEKEALAIVTAGLAVKNSQDVVKVFRLGDSSEGDVLEFMAGLPGEEIFTGLEWVGTSNVNRMALEVVIVSFTENGEVRNRIAALTPDTEGVWKIDFDAFARTVKPSWEDFLSGKSETAKVRVYITSDTYYNGIFNDDSKWRCAEMASPDSEGSLLGYTAKPSPQNEALEWILLNRSGVTRATLEIKRSASANKRQVEIVRVLADDWVIGDVPFDENFR